VGFVGRSLFARRSARLLNAMNHQCEKLVIYTGVEKRLKVDVGESLDEEVERVGQHVMLIRRRQMGAAVPCRPSRPACFEGSLEPSRPRVLLQSIWIALEALDLPFVEPVNPAPVAAREQNPPFETAHGRDALPKPSGHLAPRELHVQRSV
jgi:hypothetical protein